MDLEKETIIAAFAIADFSAPRDIKFITSKGIIKKTEMSKFITSYSKLQAIKLRKDETLVSVKVVTKDEEEKFINITTTKGLNFIVHEPMVEPVDRTILGKSLVELTEGDSILSCDYVDEYNYKEFYVTVNKKGILKISNRRSSEEVIVETNSEGQILFFAENGDIFKISSVILQNIDKKGIRFEMLFPEYSDNNPIISAIAAEERKAGEEVLYFFTEKGVVKKSPLKEFLGDYSYNTGYKFKTEGDKLVKVYSDLAEGEGVILTRKGMCLKFVLDSISTVGKNATGVMGISLREDDSVIFAKAKGILKSPSGEELCVGLSDESLKITTSKAEEKIIDLGELPIQNRAGRGKNVMVFMEEDGIIKAEIVK